MKTASLWGPPPSRYYRFLSQVRSVSGHGPASLAVLGCADGKFVLPAARRGLRVYAIDVDPVAIHGGSKLGVGGQVHMPGLISRLQVERLTDAVDVRVADFTKEGAVPCDAVMTSGSIQYSRNFPLTAAEILRSILDHVKPGGLL